MSDYPVTGDRRITVDTTTGRWDGGRHYVAKCDACEYRSPKLSRQKAYEAAQAHADTHEHWMWRTRIIPRPKRLTSDHWSEIREADPYDPRLRNGWGDADEADRKAREAGYEDDGAFRPWYRQHVMGMVALTGDGDAFEVINRLNEIARAQREVAGLTEALREWLAMVDLIASVRGDG